MSSKMPGSSLRIEPVKMDFHYGTSFGKATPEAYERLLLDAMSGMPRSSRAGTKWKRRGNSSTPFVAAGTAMATISPFTLPEAGGPARPMS